jgi:hypothetical protein
VGVHEGPTYFSESFLEEVGVEAKKLTGADIELSRLMDERAVRGVWCVVVWLFCVSCGIVQFFVLRRVRFSVSAEHCRLSTNSKLVNTVREHTHPLSSLSLNVT